MLLVSVAPGDYTFTVSGYINGHLVAETDNDITISGSETSVTLALKDIAKGNAGDLTLVVYLPYDCSGFDASSTITVTFTDGAVYTTTFGELSGHITEGSDDSGDYIEVVIPSGEALWTTGGVTSALPAGVGEMVLSLSYDGEIAESRAYCTLWDGVGLTGKVDMKRGEVSFFQWCFLDLPESLEYDQIGYGNGCFLLTEKHNSDNELSYVYSYAMRSVDSGWKIKEFDYYISDITFFKNQFVCVNMGAYSGSIVYFDGYLYGDNASSTFGMSSVLVSPSDISQYTAKAGDPDATVSLYRSADGLSWERLYITPSHMDDPFHPLIAGNSIVFFQNRYTRDTSSTSDLYFYTYSNNILNESLILKDSDYMDSFYVNGKVYILVTHREGEFPNYIREKRYYSKSQNSELIRESAVPIMYTIDEEYWLESNGDIVICVFESGKIYYTSNGYEWIEQTPLEVGSIYDVDYSDGRILVLGTTGIAYCNI